MDYMGWILIGVSVAGLYVLGLISYRLLLSARSLQSEVARSQGLVNQVKNFEELRFPESKPSTGSDLGKLLVARHKLIAAKEKRAEERRRRLIQGIREIETDKR